MAAAWNVKSINPYEYCFKRLSCKVKLVAPQSDTYQLLLRYMNSGLAQGNQNQARKFTMSGLYEVA